CTVTCFCDKRNCEDSLICSNEKCLIGFRNEDSQTHLEQLCSSASEARDLLKCQHNWNGWQEICACEEDFCNTFAYLRGSIEEESLSNDLDDDLRRPLVNEKEKFKRINLQEQSSEDSVRKYHGSNLIVLLVIIPLLVGALAVCLIFINYHCKMC
ncbi:unnamed protein product, partial [Thelazia callipaeda]|uniref:Activin_recp domain-containing protein n=1 Tax=Thelazia callipaeda TaxID=103827 RepID=A0A0N5CKI1_THECL